MYDVNSFILFNNFVQLFKVLKLKIGFTVYLSILIIGGVILIFISPISAQMAMQTQKISFDDIYQMEIDLRLGGNVEIIATDRADIIVTYPEFATMEMVKNGDTLTLKPISRSKDIVDQESLALNCKFETPMDLSLVVRNVLGNVKVFGIRGKLDLQTQTGDIQLHETTGQHYIGIENGSIDAQIYLTNTQNKFRTDNGHIHLTILDMQPASIDIKAFGGGIHLGFPEGFAAILEIFDEGSIDPKHFVINDGRHLIRLESTGQIEIMGSSNNSEPEVTDIETEEQEIAKQKPMNYGFSPHFFAGYNRVHGLRVGGKVEVKPVIDETYRSFASIGYGFASRRLNYQLGVEKWWFDHYNLVVGTTFYNVTDELNYGGLSTGENLVSSAVFGSAPLDYFQRHGFHAWLKQKLTSSNMLKVAFTSENHQNLFKWTDWSLFNRYNYNWDSLFSDDGFNWLNLFYDRNREDLQPGVWGRVHPKPSNRRIDVGRLQSITLSYCFDNRDYKFSRVRFFQSKAVPHYLTSEGWLGHCSVEQTGFGSELGFTLFHLEVVHYRLLSSQKNLKFRLQAGFSPQGLPRQKLFYLGGLNTIRGYGFKTFEGENKILFNIEFNQKCGANQPIVAGFFFDAGQAWYSSRHWKINEFATSIGLGVSLFLSTDQEQSSIVRFELAKPLKKGYGFQPTIRISQML